METNAELNQKLMGGSSCTVFAPTDDAFLNATSRLDQLSEKEMEEIILFHFNENVVKTLGDLACTEQLTSLSGEKSRTKCRRISVGVYLKHQRGDGNLDLDQFPIINVNSNEACDGIVHRLDTVMLPKVYKPFKDLVPSEKKPPQMAILPDVEEPIIINDNEDDDEEVVPPTEPPTEPPTDSPPSEEVSPSEAPPSEEVPPSEAPANEGGNSTGETDDEPSEGDDSTEETSDNNAVDLQKPDPGTSSTTIENAVDGEETKKKGIGALGINLIIFSTLLLCFVFVCMRR